MLRLVIKEPNKSAQIHLFDDTEDILSLMQRLVDGYIECCYISKEVVLLCNEDGIYKKLPQNCGYLGTIIFVGNTEDWSSLTEEQAKKAVKWCELHEKNIHSGDAGYKFISDETEINKVLRQGETVRKLQDVEWEIL